MNRRNLSKKNFLKRICDAITIPIEKAFSVPKVQTVFRNIGTCVVNGAMELISHYFPAPLIPLIASAAGILIPFEPVVMLKSRNPVNNYRRAFNSAINTFLGNFDKYRLDDDPYMTKKFNRRFMNEPDNEIKKKKDEEDNSDVD